MASRQLELADLVAAAIVTAVGTPTPPSQVAVERVYVPSADPEAMQSNRRRVDVYPIKRSDAGPLSRGTDGMQNQIGVVIYERYTETGNATKEWMDARVTWVQEVIEPILKDPQTRYDGAYPETYDCETFSPEQLTTNKLFWCEIIVTLMDEE